MWNASSTDREEEPLIGRFKTMRESYCGEETIRNLTSNGVLDNADLTEGNFTDSNQSYLWWRQI